MFRRRRWIALVVCCLLGLLGLLLAPRDGHGGVYKDDADSLFINVDTAWRGRSLQDAGAADPSAGGVPATPGTAAAAAPTAVPVAVPAAVPAAVPTAVPAAAAATAMPVAAPVVAPAAVPAAPTNGTAAGSNSTWTLGANSSWRDHMHHSHTDILVEIFGMRVGSKLLTGFGFVLTAIAAILLRKEITSTIYSATCAKWHCPSVRNIECVGRLCSCFCCCWFPSFHENFRLRIVLHEGHSLRKTDWFTQMQCQVVVVCGNNPWKTTSFQMVPGGNDMSKPKPKDGSPPTKPFVPIRWEETIDIEVGVADELIKLQVVDYDYGTGNDVVGSGLLYVSDFWRQMEAEGGILQPIWKNKFLENLEIRLVYEGNKPAGSLVVSLYATRPGKSLPPIVPGMLQRGGAQETHQLLSK